MQSTEKLHRMMLVIVWMAMASVEMTLVLPDEGGTGGREHVGGGR
jgi:hypothetical protein